MAQTLKFQNYGSTNIVDQTVLIADVPISSTSLTVNNNNDFLSGVPVLIGETGSKDGELILSTPTTAGTSVPLAAQTKLLHYTSEPIYALFGDSIKVYRATNVDGTQPLDSAFTLLQTISIDPNDFLTTFTDSTGGGGYWYKYTYYNSTSLFQTSLGIANAVRGTFIVSYASLDQIRRQAGFRYAPNVSDDQIDEKRREAQDHINGALNQFYDIPFSTPVPATVEAMTIKFAAGYLRMAQYSQLSDPTLNGQNMADDAQIILDQLVMKETVVVNNQGQSMDLPGSTGGVNGWPNQDTATTYRSEGGAPRVFRMGDIQGTPAGHDESGNPNGNGYYGRKW
jgi:hypothetical protein